MNKRGQHFELIAREFLERIFAEIGYEVVRQRTQNSGTQDGFDILIEIVTDKYKNYIIYAECKDYSTALSYTQAVEKIPHIISTHEKIDLLLFISPHRDFKNPNEPSKLQGFYDKLADTCPVQFLSPEYHIREYFTLYPDLFKKVYNENIEELLPEQRKLLLNKFDKLIFSDKNLHKIIIEESDKETYIGLIQNSPNHIKRTLRTNPQKDLYIWDKPNYNVDTGKLLNDCKHGVVILGNPGSGKTTELKNIALNLWRSREKSNIIPYYISLKNFNSTSTIDDLLPKSYMHIPYLVIIMDGLDEVYDISDFSNKLRTFIEKGKKTNKKNSLKIIISCRTSIYNKIVKNLDGFTTAFLNPVSEGQAVRFLADKYKIDFINKHSDFNFWKNRDLLESPFYLELIGKNYLSKGKIEISRSKLIDQYIKDRLEVDESDKFRNDAYSRGLHLEMAKKLAFAMETMQLSAIEDSNARALIGDTINLSKNPFIEQTIDKKWSFELKNIQEFLVADMLSKMEFDQLIELISIDEEINKVHPSWHNVVVLLLNIKFEKNETHSRLINWLVTNDLEMVFLSEVELISEEIRNTALQTFFQLHCVEKTLWIDNEGSVGRFGDTACNITYLFNKALDSTLNLRTRLSAIVLLENMSLTGDEAPKHLQKLLAQTINEFKVLGTDFIHIMQRTLSLIKRTNEKQIPISLKTAIDFVSEYDYREFVHIVLPMINANNFETYKHFVIDVLKKAIREKSWNYKSKYGATISTKKQIFNIFSQIESTSILIYLLDFISHRLRNHELKKEYREKFIQHCSDSLRFIENKDKEKLVQLIIDVITSNKVYHTEKHLLVSFARNCSIDEEVFKRLLAVENDKHSNIFFLELILKKDWYHHIVNSYKSGIFTGNFLIKIRNRMQYDNLSHAIQFQTYIENNSQFKFEDRIENSKVIEWQEFEKNREQREFDVMFDVDRLKTHIRSIFHHYKTKKLSYSDVDKFWDEYYDDFETQKNISEYSKRFLWEVLNNDYKQEQKLDIKDLDHVLAKKELERLDDIYQTLPKKDSAGIAVKDFQRKILERWVIKNRAIVENYLDNPEQEVTSSEAKTLNLFLNLFSYFKFPVFEDRFLLRLIDFVNYGYFDFQSIENLVDEGEITEKVLAKLKKNSNPETQLQLLMYLKSKNILLNLDEYGISEDVQKSILNREYDYARAVIELYYVENVSFLKTIANLYLEKTEDYHLLPFILNSLISQNQYEFIRNYITENYQLLVERKLLEESKAIEYLIKANGKLGFMKLKSIIFNTTSNAGDTYYDLEYVNYSNSESIEDLLEIANHCLSLSNYKCIFNGWFNPMTKISETLVNIGRSSDLKTSQGILKKIEAIKPLIDETQDNRFYHEKLIADIKNVIYKHKSKPFTLKEARILNEKYEDMFY